MVFEASLIGIFSSVTKFAVDLMGGPDLSWIVYAALSVAAIGVFG
ncbi:hypothetical protein [Acrocarpospora sp. B8E8]